MLHKKVYKTKRIIKNNINWARTHQKWNSPHLRSKDKILTAKPPPHKYATVWDFKLLTKLTGFSLFFLHS